MCRIIVAKTNASMQWISYLDHVKDGTKTRIIKMATLNERPVESKQVETIVTCQYIDNGSQ